MYIYCGLWIFAPGGMGLCGDEGGGGGGGLGIGGVCAGERGGGEVELWCGVLVVWALEGGRWAFDG